MLNAVHYFFLSAFSCAGCTVSPYLGYDSETENKASFYFMNTKYILKQFFNVLLNAQVS